MELLIEANELRNNWARKRRNTVKLFRDLVDDIRARTKKSRDATIGGASFSVAGGLVAAAAGISVIVSGGTTLPIAAAAVGSTSAGVGVVGGMVVLGSELYNIVNAEAVKLLHKAIVTDKKESAKLWEVLQMIEANINGVEVPTVRFVINLGDFRYNRYDLGNNERSANQVAVANNPFQALDDFVRFSYVDSIGLSSISLLFNDKTLRETLATVRKGEVLRVASDLRRQAGKLEDELPVYKKKAKLLKRRVHEKELELQRRAKEKEKELELLKRRVHEKELELQRRAKEKEKELELLKRRVHEQELELQRRAKEKEKELELLKRRDHEKELELQRRAKEKELELLKRRVERSFYMAFFVCCIGIIIYFLCYRL